MKTCPRNHSKNATNPATVKPKTGHDDTTSGQKLSLSCLDENQIAALPILAKWCRKSPDGFCEEGINALLKACIEDIEIQLRDGTPAEKKAALSLLRSLPEPLRPSTVKIYLEPLAPGIISKPLADEAKAALEELQRAGAAAVSLLMMAADTLSGEAADFEPKNDELHQWRKLIELNFGGGIFDLVIDQVARFKDAMTEWRIEQLSIIACEPRPESKVHLEEEVHCLNTLSRYLSNVLSNHYSYSDQSAGAAVFCWRAGQNLHGAWLKSFAILKKLHDAIAEPATTHQLRKAA